MPGPSISDLINADVAEWEPFPTARFHNLLESWEEAVYNVLDAGITSSTRTYGWNMLVFKLLFVYCMSVSEEVAKLRTWCLQKESFRKAWVDFTSSKQWEKISLTWLLLKDKIPPSIHGDASITIESWMNYACSCDPNSHWTGEVEMKGGEQERGWGRMLCRPERASLT